jgi:protein-L-isoaspartate(D-aspartate) O-methyltransferase
LAACPEAVPQSLFDQLADGGRLIAPVGLGQKQQLILYRRDGDSIEETALDTAFFVPALAGLQ